MQRRTAVPWMQPPLADDVFVFEKNATLALVSESFSERFSLRRGDAFTLPTPTLC